MTSKRINLKKTYDVTQLSFEDTVNYSKLVGYSTERRNSLTEKDINEVHSKLIQLFPKNFYTTKKEEEEKIVVSEVEKFFIPNTPNTPGISCVTPKTPKTPKTPNTFISSSEFINDEVKEVEVKEVDQNEEEDEFSKELEKDLEELRQLEQNIHLKDMSTAKLKQLCKSHKLKNYSKFKKDELIELLLNSNVNEIQVPLEQKEIEIIGENYDEETLKTLSSVKLKQICKSRKLKKYSKLKKEELIQLILNQEECVEEEIQEDIKENYDEESLKRMSSVKLKQICKSRKLKKYSKLKKEELIQLILEQQNNVGVENQEVVQEETEEGIEDNYDEETLKTLSSVKLKQICKSRKLKKYSKLKKEELIQLILGL